MFKVLRYIIIVLCYTGRVFFMKKTKLKKKMQTTNSFTENGEEKYICVPLLDVQAMP